MLKISSSLDMSRVGKLEMPQRRACTKSARAALMLSWDCQALRNASSVVV
jgi:hypothetical protein